MSSALNGTLTSFMKNSLKKAKIRNEHFTSIFLIPWNYPVDFWTGCVKGHRKVMLLLDINSTWGQMVSCFLAVFRCLLPETVQQLRLTDLNSTLKHKKSSLGSSAVSLAISGKRRQRDLLFCQVHCCRVRRLEEGTKMRYSLSAHLSAWGKPLLLFSL